MELLTVQETAEMLKVTPITIRRYIAEGRPMLSHSITTLGSMAFASSAPEHQCSNP